MFSKLLMVCVRTQTAMNFYPSPPFFFSREELAGQLSKNVRWVDKIRKARQKENDRFF